MDPSVNDLETAVRQVLLDEVDEAVKAAARAVLAAGCPPEVIWAEIRRRNQGVNAPLVLEGIRLWIEQETGVSLPCSK